MLRALKGSPNASQECAFKKMMMMMMMMMMM